MFESIAACTQLHNGIRMPWLGLGVFNADEGKVVQQAVAIALENGYRSIDTAKMYYNERGVGKAVKDSGIARKEIFITTKVWNSDQGYERTLQAFHESLEKLACEYIGITRNRSDAFFDGSRGKRLVKIIPFNHPLTPLDLESIRDELERRPEEERDIEIVCLGMELTAQAWLENYNRNRPINKFYLFELRTDNKYGGFIKHEPLTASVKIKRKGDKVLIDVNDVYSPRALACTVSW